MTLTVLSGLLAGTLRQVRCSVCNTVTEGRIAYSFAFPAASFVAAWVPGASVEETQKSLNLEFGANFELVVSSRSEKVQDAVLEVLIKRWAGRMNEFTLASLNNRAIEWLDENAEQIDYATLAAAQTVLEYVRDFGGTITIGPAVDETAARDQLIEQGFSFVQWLVVAKLLQSQWHECSTVRVLRSIGNPGADVQLAPAN